MRNNRIVSTRLARGAAHARSLLFLNAAFAQDLFANDARAGVFGEQGR